MQAGAPVDPIRIEAFRTAVEPHGILDVETEIGSPVHVLDGAQRGVQTRLHRIGEHGRVHEHRLDVIAPAEWLRTAGAKATTFGATDRAMFVSGDGTLDMTPLIDGAYPDLGRAFSPERLRSDSVAKVERAALVKAARTMRRLVDDKPVMETRFGSDGVTMTLRGADQDVVQWVPAEVSADATRRINIDYLLDALAALGSDDVEVRPGRMFRFVDESDPSTLVVAAEFRGNQE